jgi:hypothetical protein
VGASTDPKNTTHTSKYHYRTHQLVSSYTHQVSKGQTTDWKISSSKTVDRNNRIGEVLQNLPSRHLRDQERGWGTGATIYLDSNVLHRVGHPDGMEMDTKRKSKVWWRTTLSKQAQLPKIAI